MKSGNVSGFDDEQENMMTKEELEQLRKLPAEIKVIQDDINNLPITTDSVTGSRRRIPFDKHSIPIEGLDLKKRLRLKMTLERKLNALQEALEGLEDYLDTIEDSEMRTILRLRYRNGLTQGEIAHELKYTRSAVAMKLERFFKNSKV